MAAAPRFILVAFATAAAFSPAKAAPANADGRIAHVEAGLIPGIVFRGEAGRSATLADRMRYHKVPGISLAVINDNAVAWARGYGVARAVQPEPVTPRTVFQCGALSKVVSAVGVLRLAESKGISLDADVNERLLTWKVPPGALTSHEKVTLRRLLSHTAGVNIDGFAGYAPGQPLPTLRQLLDGTPPARNAAVAVEAVPGRAYRPSGGAFLILQQLIQDVEGRTFDDWAKTEVFDKLRMADSTFAQPLPDKWRARTACGHSEQGDPLAGGWRVYPEQAAAGLWTTPSDLAALMLEISSAASGHDGKVLSAAAARQMLTPQTRGVGFCFQLKGSDRGRQFSHAGRNSGFDALMVMYPGTGQGAVVMLNCNNNDGLAAEVVQSIAREYQWPDYKPTTQREVRAVDPELLKSYEGRYGSRGDSEITVRSEGRRLFLEGPGVGRLELFGEEGETFAASRLPLRVAFKKPVAGRPSVLEILSGSSRQEVPRAADRAE
jgi:CubicO group peptidase (beta-lactamase class C family)